MKIIVSKIKKKQGNIGIPRKSIRNSKINIDIDKVLVVDDSSNVSYLLKNIDINLDDYKEIIEKVVQKNGGC